MVGTRVPVVRVSDPWSGFACDISLNNFVALQHTELLAVYVRIDPRFRALAAAVKAWARLRRLNNPRTGTLSSFALILMVVHYLQVIHPPILPCLFEPDLQLRGKALARFHEQARGGGPADPVLHLSSSHDSRESGISRQLACAGKGIRSNESSSTGESPGSWPEDRGKILSAFHRDGAALEGWGSDNTASVGDLLLGFFRYFAFLASYHTHAISVRAGYLVPRSLLPAALEAEAADAARGDGRAKLAGCLWVEDPIDGSYNVAKQASCPPSHRQE